MKNYYQLLGLEPTALSDEIKRAFRREIARYHPDKVQHLGSEFQEIAATRAAELTEAYRVLMDAEARRKYDDALEQDAPPPPAPAPPPPSPARRPEPPWPRPQEPAAGPFVADPPDRRFERERATTSDFLRKAAIAKLRDAVGAVAGSSATSKVPGFDAVHVIKPRKGLFRKAEPPVRLLARFVPQVDAAAIEDAWPLVSKSGAFDGIVCLMLLGSGVSPPKELGAAVAEQRRKARAAGPVVVPVDVRDWEALFPPETPDVVRQVVQRLRSGS